MTIGTRKQASSKPNLGKLSGLNLLVVTNVLPTSRNDSNVPFLIDFVHSMDKLGANISCFSPRMTTVSEEIDFPVYRFDWGEARFSPCGLPPMKFSTYKKIRNYFKSGKATLLQHLSDHKYDHILAIPAFPAGWFAREVSLETKIPYSVWSFSDDINRWSHLPIASGIVRRVLRGAEQRFANGDELSERVTQLVGKECKFLPASRTLNYRLLRIPREKFFLYLGKIEKCKGVFDLLNAFARIKEDIWDYRLLFIGTGSAFPAMQKAIDHLHLRGKVHLLGQVSIEEVVNYLQRARALVIPSHAESISHAFYEALQTSTPIVTTSVGDMGTLVRDNKLGFVVQRKSVRKLTDALVKMIVTDFELAETATNLYSRLSPQSGARTLLETIAIKTLP